MDPNPPARRKGTRGPGILGPGAKRFNVWIPGPMFARLELIAQRGHLDTAVVIRKLLGKALKGEPEQLSYNSTPEPKA